MPSLSSLQFNPVRADYHLILNDIERTAEKLLSPDSPFLDATIQTHAVAQEWANHIKAERAKLSDGYFSTECNEEYRAWFPPLALPVGAF